MASMAMTEVQTRTAICLLLAVTLVGVHGRSNPEDHFTLTEQGNVPTTRGWRFRNPFGPSGSSIPVDSSQPTNLDESQQQFWASTQNTQDQRGSGATSSNQYNYAMDATTKGHVDEYFFTPETVARINAYNEAHDQAAQEMAQNYEAKTRSEYSKVMPDGTELLWVTGPEKASPAEIARLEAMIWKAQSTAARPQGVQRHDINADSSNWEDGPWGTKHRPGAEHSLTYVGFVQPDGTTVPQSNANYP